MSSPKHGTVSRLVGKPSGLCAREGRVELPPSTEIELSPPCNAWMDRARPFLRPDRHGARFPGKPGNRALKYGVRG